MRVTLLAVFIIASFFCAPSSSSDSTIGVPEAVRPRDLCSSAGRSFRRGHSTLLVRRNCVEAKYEEDFFRAAGPGEKSAPRGEPVSAMGTQQGKESWASIAKRNIGLHEDSDAEPRESDGAPTGASPQAARRHHGSTSSMATQTRGGSGGGTAGVASGLGWSQVVRGGYSDGGADVAGEGADWPSAVPALDMVSARPDGTLPPEGCIWDPQERRWGEVRLCPGATRAGGGGAIRVRRMRVEDIRRFGPINDACRWTATFSDAYYAAHIHRWPDMCLCAEGGDGELMGYIIGKSEAGPEGLFVHVTALTVKAEHRRRGIASRLMAQLEVLGAARLGALYVDLFVKEINARAVAYYKSIGYVTSRVLSDYYDDCNALDMRKSLPADRNNKRMVPKVR